MVSLSPYVLRTAMMMEELDDESKRAAYMVVNDMKRLQDLARAGQSMADFHGGEHHRKPSQFKS